MLKSVSKIIIGSVLVTAIFLIISLIAAPYFVRQEQVTAFLEKNVELPKGRKIKFDSEVSFGIFPYSYLEFARAEIISENGDVQTIEDFLLGFTFNDLLSKGIDFDFNAKFSGNLYKGNLLIKDFKNFRTNRKSPIVLSLESPIPATLNGVIEFKDKTKKLSDFAFVHKDSVIRGNISITNNDNGRNEVSGDLVANSANIDQIRRIIDLENYNDPYTPFTGKGVINVVSFSTAGASDEEYKKNLKFSGDVKISDADFYGFDLSEFVANPIGTNFKKDPAKKTHIDNISGNFAALDGVLGLHNINAHNQVSKLVANGNYNLLTEQVDVMSDITAMVAGQEVNVPVKISGDVKSPKVVPNIGEGIAKNLPAIQKVINSEEGQKIINKIDDALKDSGGLKGLLEGLGGGTQEGK